MPSMTAYGGNSVQILDSVGQPVIPCHIQICIPHMFIGNPNDKHTLSQATIPLELGVYRH